MNRKFYTNKNLSKLNRIKLNKEQTYKIRHVLRLTKGDIIEIFNNEIIAIAEIIIPKSDGCVVQIKEKRQIDITEPNLPSIHLFQSFPKNPKSELIVRSSVALGVSSIRFWGSERSVIKVEQINEKKLERLIKIAVEESQITFNPSPPNIFILKDKDLEEIINEYHNKFDHIFYLDIHGQTLDGVSENIFISGKNVAIFIGPEGGFSPKEKEIFHKYNIHAIKIYSNNLRVEEAISVFMSQIWILNKINTKINHG
ncbi:MAG: RsmE family RNA methyltransferase [Candidatus Dojkabacteria bacterium]|nr:RsmE family RNA methyltransferase [Candidatus Dojkabacteria bacterium]